MAVFFFFFNYVRQETREKNILRIFNTKNILYETRISFANYVIITKDTFAEEDRV